MPAYGFATLDVLTKLGPPAHYTDAKLRSMVICRAVNLSLEGGNCDGSCYAYAVLAGLLDRNSATTRRDFDSAVSAMNWSNSAG